MICVSNLVCKCLNVLRPKYISAFRITNHSPTCSIIMGRKPAIDNIHFRKHSSHLKELFGIRIKSQPAQTNQSSLIVTVTHYSICIFPSVENLYGKCIDDCMHQNIYTQHRTAHRTHVSNAKWRFKAMIVSMEYVYVRSPMNNRRDLTKLCLQTDGNTVLQCR